MNQEANTFISMATSALEEFKKLFILKVNGDDDHPAECQYDVKSLINLFIKLYLL